ncbi:MAG: hypothetical protein PVI23_06695, partial [Maricaulaceae bacterium]
QIYFVPESRNHYLSASGWVQDDAAGVLRRIPELFGYLFIRAQINRSAMFVLAAIALGGLLSALQRRARRSAGSSSDAASEAKPGSAPEILLVFSAFWILAAALTFGPPLAITQTADRYFELPVLLTLLSIGPLFAAAGLRFRTQGSVAIAFAACVIVLPWLNQSYASDHLAGRHRIARAIESQFDYLSRHWEEQAQIVITGPALAGEGFNHWSTGYLRHLSGRSDIIGLLGVSRDATRFPIVSRYTDHDDRYWATNQAGAAYRIRMIGLEADRPTYSYRLDADLTLQPVGVTIAINDDDNSIYAAGYGESFSAHSIDDDVLGELCALTERSMGGATLFGRLRFEQQAASAGLTNTFTVDGSSPVRVAPAVADDSALRGRFRLVPGEVDFGDSQFGERYPPTPILWRDGFQLWNTAPGEWQLQVGDSGQASTGEELYFEFEVHPGCLSMFRMNNAGLLAFTPGAPAGEIELGRGFLDRSWRGDVFTSLNATAGAQANVD